LAELAKQPVDSDGVDDECEPPLDAPPVAPAGWTPAPVVKSTSDPNIARLPGKMVSRVLTRLLTLLVQRLAGTNRLLALIIAEFVCALRKSEWLMKLVGKSVCHPVADGIATAAKERPDGDGLPFIAPNSPMPPTTGSVDVGRSPTPRCRSLSPSPSQSPAERWCARASPHRYTRVQDAEIPPLALGVAATFGE
jgi:hypothetical protein